MNTPVYPVSLTYAANHNGPRLPVVNRRVIPTDAGNYVMRTDSMTVELWPDDGQVGFVRLYERSISEFGGKGMLVRDTLANTPLQGSITYPPNNETFYINPYMGIVFFNKSDVGKKVTCVYQAMGSIVAGEEINYIHTNAYNAALPWQAGNAHIIIGGATKRWDRLIIDRVWEVMPDGSTYKPDPAEIDVSVYDADNIDAYYSILKNLSSVTRTFKVKLVPHVLPPL